MDKIRNPFFFQKLYTDNYIKDTDILKTSDGFHIIYKSLADILAEKNILDFIDSDGIRLACCNFFDDWFLYAVPNTQEHTYSLLKLREQEHDAENDNLADGDTPGVTISFIEFTCEILLNCLNDPTDENKQKLSREINRVVAYRGQRHHEILKRYFTNPSSEGSYLVAFQYAKHIASFAENGILSVPEHYSKIVLKSAKQKNSSGITRLPRFIASINQKAGYVVCDNEYLYIKNPQQPDTYECLAILATHTGNTSVYSFAAEVEFHAKFLTPYMNMKLPFIRKSIYESAIRADMTIGDAEAGKLVPFYNENSKIVQRQYSLHKNITTKF